MSLCYGLLGVSLILGGVDVVPALVCIFLSLPNSFRLVLCLMISSIVLSLSDIVSHSVYYMMRLLGTLYFMYA